MVRRSRKLYSDPVMDSMTGYVDHHIIGSTAAQTDYQVQLRVYREYGVNTWSTVYIPPSEVRSDFTDLRIVDEVGRLLPYYIETVGSGYVDIWVMLYSISPNGAIIRLCYGAGNIQGVSSGARTFPLLFDHFDGAALDTTLWSNQGTATVSQASSVATVSKAASSYAGIQSVATNLGTGTALRCYAKQGGSVNYQYIGYSSGITGIDYANEVWVSDSAGQLAVYARASGSGGSTNFTGHDTSTYHIYELCRDGTSNIFAYMDGTLKGTRTTTLPSVDLSCILAVYNSTLYVDYIYCRKYANPEPSHGWWGVPEDF